MLGQVVGTLLGTVASATRDTVMFSYKAITRSGVWCSDWSSI